MFSKNFTNNSQSGFSFIEVMIGVLIVSIAAYGMVVGATHARGELRAIAVKERATEELLSFVTRDAQKKRLQNLSKYVT